MSFMPIDEIRGNHLMQAPETGHLSMHPIDFESLSAQIEEPIELVGLKSWLGQTVIEVKTTRQTLLFDANNLQSLSPINEAQVQQIISSRFLPQYKIKAINYLPETPGEARGRTGPLWQVALSGQENPKVYISPHNGEIVAVRTDRWRLFDFLWMLHIMDYDERSDFNHPLLYLTAFTALLFTISGFVLIFFGFKPAKRRKK